MDKRAGISIWDILIWFGILLILVWAVLKSFGVINSPTWFEMLPFYGIGSAAIGTAYKLGKIMEGISITNKKVNRLVVMEEDFRNLERTHNLCIDGQLKGSPNKRK